MANNKVRLRFAPSPTGALHIGGIRTALYNYLFARQNRGSFILRIEDTDQTRYVEGAEQYIIESLKWVGLIPDEGPGFGGEFGPYRQSERKDIYLEYAKRLVDSGKAYYAFDSQEEIEAMKTKYAQSENDVVKYDYLTRAHMRNSINLSSEEVETLLKSGHEYTIRLKVPADEIVEINDTIRGLVRFSTSELDDKVLIKSDGLPTYHLANVVDDRLMEITHVIRGEEWLSSTAHHVLLYHAFGWEAEMPIFAHLPLILKPTGNGKLSKRDGATFGFPVFPISWAREGEDFIYGFREAGFLPDALLNFLVLLGWNPGTEQEIFSRDQMISSFSIDHIVKSGARFDFEKARWFNHQYIQSLSPDQLKLQVQTDAKNSGILASSEELESICSMYQSRSYTLSELWNGGKWICMPPHQFDEDFMTKKWKTGWLEAYQSLAERLSNANFEEKDSLAQTLHDFQQTYGFKMGEMLPTLRVILSGKPMGPDIYEMLMATGKEESIKRLNYFVTHNNN